MNRTKLQSIARRYFAYLATLLVAACGGGGGGDSTTPPPPPPPPTASVTFEAQLIDVAMTDMTTGDPISVDGLPIGSAVITVTQ